MYYYTAYGLTVASEVPLPNVLSSVPPNDISIEVDPDLKPPPDSNVGEVCLWSTPSTAYLQWDPVGLFLLEDGRSIAVRPKVGVPEGLLQTFLLLPVLNFLLHQRGFFLLHASVVEINGYAVAFAGRKGWGKSTLAAHLQLRGHPLISDDNLVINLAPHDNSIVALPGIPQTRLWPDSLASLGVPSDTLPRIYPDVDKRVGQVSPLFGRDPIPLACIYILDFSSSSDVVIEQTNARDALHAVLSYSYAGDVAYSGFDLLAATGSRARHFQQCAQVAKSVPIRTLKRPFHLSEMENVTSCVEQDINTLVTL